MNELKVRDDMRQCTYILKLNENSEVIEVITQLDEPRPLISFFNLTGGLASIPPRPPQIKNTQPTPPPVKLDDEGRPVCPLCGTPLVKEACCGGKERWRCPKCNYRSL